MKTYWQKVFSRARHVLVNSKFLGKVAGEVLPKSTKEQQCLNCIHLWTSMVATEKCFNMVHSQRILSVHYRNGCSSLDQINPQRRSSTSRLLSHTSKWDGQTLNFVENENEYFHSYLESTAEYQPYFLSFLSTKAVTLPHETVTKLLQEIKERKQTDKLLMLLEHWSGVARVEGCTLLSDKSFSSTVKLLQRNVKCLSADEVLQSMVYLNSLGFRQNVLMSEPRKNRIIISKTFDQACTLHFQKMDIKQLLLAADFFYSLRGSSFVEFNFLMCERMKFFLPLMTKPELILLLFHMSMTRRTPHNMVHTVLGHLKQHLNSLTLQELAIVNLAHYKTQSLVKQPEYFMALTAQLKRGVDLDLDPVCLSAMLKYQHRSLNRCKDQLLPQFFTTVKDMEDSLIQRVPRLPSETLMRVLNLYYSVDLLSEDLFMAGLNRIIHTGVQDWRLKDIAKVVHILTNIPLGSESKAEALEAVLADLQRKERQAEIDDHPGCLLQIAVSLTRCCMYPHWLVRKIFVASSQKYFRDSKIDYRQELYHLSQSVSIEDGTYEGPLLHGDRFSRLSKNKVYRKLTQTREGSPASDGIWKSLDGDPTSGNILFHRDLILQDLMDALIQARPLVSPLPSFLLSHFHTADVEIRCTQGSDSQDHGNVSKLCDVADKNCVREAVVLHASNAYQTVRCRDGSTVPLLRQYHAMRARQLRALGATVTEVPHFEFEASSNKCQYLLTKF